MLNEIFEIAQSFLMLILGIVLNFLAIFGIISPQIEQTNTNLAENEANATTTQGTTSTDKLPEKIEVIVVGTENKKTSIKYTQPIQGQKDDNIQLSETINKAVLQAQNLLKNISEKQSAQTNIDLNKLAREALVNILCTTKIGGLLKPLTGSGVIINEKGVILTNAHIGQYFLIKDYPTQDSINCIIRNGSPASVAYKAKILYISPVWIKENANTIIVDNPKGTGENDFAFLLITDSLRKGSSLPEKFPFLAPDILNTKMKTGIPVLLASYPAGFLGGITIQKDLWITTTISSIKELFTFRNGTVDIFSLNGNIVAQKGSSGGAVVNETTNKLNGIIVTSSDASSTDDRELNAITLFHINDSINKDLGFGLSTLLKGNLQLRSETFNRTNSPTLRQLLVNEMEK